MQSIVAMASDVKLALSMRIARHGGDTEVAVAANVSLVWEYTGEMDELPVNGRICMRGGPNRRIKWVNFLRRPDLKATCSLLGVM